MSTPLDPQKKEHPSTYFVQDRQNEKELTRLTIQDHMITAGVGGVLPEQPDPTVLHRVLDVGCGTGGWIIEAARAYPMMSLIGIDISQRMVEYARAQTEARQVNDRVEFHVMDALRMLEFPAGFFDLVNLRFGASFLRTWDWPKMLTEMQRVARPGGVVRVTESGSIENNSPALTQLFEMARCALFRAGHLFTQEESAGLTDQLERLLNQYGCQKVQTKTYALEPRAGTPERKAFSENWMYAFQVGRPFLQKWGCVSKDFEAIYQQALSEMEQPDFHATWNILTAWGSKSRPKSQQSQQ